MNSTFLKQIKHDIQIGILYSWKIFIPFITIFLLASADFSSHSSRVTSHLLIQKEPSFSDYAIDIFKGMPIFNPSSFFTKFEIPALFLFITIYLSYIIGKYPFKDLKGFGIQILLRSKKRSNWWFSKCIWCMFNVIIMYIIAYVIFFFFILKTGNFTFFNNPVINQTVSEVDSSRLKELDLFLVVYILPITTSFTLSLLQMVISMFTKPIIGNILIICLIVFSAYFCKSFLVGNYIMILRNECVISNAGVNTITGLIINAIISILCIIIGAIKFKKIDILN